MSEVAPTGEECETATQSADLSALARDGAGESQEESDGGSLYNGTGRASDTGEVATYEAQAREMVALANWRRIARALGWGGWLIAEPWAAAVLGLCAGAVCLVLLVNGREMGLRLGVPGLVALCCGAGIAGLRQAALRHLRALASQMGGSFAETTTCDEAGALAAELTARLQARGVDRALLTPARLPRTLAGLEFGRPRGSTALPFQLLPDRASPALASVWLLMVLAIAGTYAGWQFAPADWRTRAPQPQAFPSTGGAPQPVAAAATPGDAPAIAPPPPSAGATAETLGQLSMAKPLAQSEEPAGGYRIVAGMFPDGKIRYAILDLEDYIQGRLLSTYQVGLGSDDWVWSHNSDTTVHWRADGEFVALSEPSHRGLGTVLVAGGRSRHFSPVTLDLAGVPLQPEWKTWRFFFSKWEADGHLVLELQHSPSGGEPQYVSFAMPGGNLGTTARVVGVPARTPASPVPSPEPTTQQLREFLDLHLKHEQSRNMAIILPDYDATVNFFDEGWVNQETIRKGKEAYFARWPRGREYMVGTPDIQPVGSTAGEPHWRCKFRTLFRVESDAGESVEGDAENTYGLVQKQGRLVIYEQTVNVTRRQRSTPAPVAVTEEDVRTFIRSHEAREQGRNLDAIAADYAPQVDYWENGKVSREFIRKDKAEYFKRWTTGEQVINSDIAVTSLGSGRFKVRFAARFAVENEKHEWVRGDTMVYYEVQSAPGGLQIVLDKGEVTRREKGTGNGAATAPSEPAPVPAGAPIKRYTGGGRVLKIPQLRDLVGQKLQNTWFYGDLMLLRWESPRAIFVTWAQFAGAGNTIVEVEFGHGCSFKGLPRGELSDAGAPGTPLFCPNATNPVQVLSVQRDANGRIVVQARHPDEFNSK